MTDTNLSAAVERVRATLAATERSCSINVSTLPPHFQDLRIILAELATLRARVAELEGRAALRQGECDAKAIIIQQLEIEAATLREAVRVCAEALERIDDADTQRLECGRHGGPYVEADFCPVEQTRGVARAALARIKTMGIGE